MPLTLDADLQGFADALDGQFALERELGRGGMGVVFLARDVRLDRPVAIKVLPPHLSSDGDVRERFLREARTAGQLSHPNIVPIYRADERGRFAYFAMAYVEGEPLADRIRDRGVLTPEDTVRWLREVAWALAYAHARGVIHRDVKPENIMIERGTNRALVTDFGIARRETSPGITADGHVVGTAYYMSPEQIAAVPLDGRSDLYSLGVVGFYALSGKLPFDGGYAPAVLVAHMTQPAPALLSVAPNVPRAIAQVIDRCLSKDPAQRYATGEALADALGKALATAESEQSREHSATSAVLSDDQAAMVWRRAAQLQAEAAARLERESRTATQRHGAVLPGETAPPTSGYRMRHVEAAAIEAGISQRFVALALSEVPTGATTAPPDPSSVGERLASALLGESRRTLSVTRVIKRPAADLLRAMGQRFTDDALGLRLRETIGGHPLDGGILVFDFGDAHRTALGPLVQTKFGIYARDIRVTVRPSTHDSETCEVSVYVDLRPGKNGSTMGYGLMSAFLGGVGALIGRVVAKKSFMLLGAALTGPTALGAVIGLAFGTLLGRMIYKYGVSASTRELEALLASLESAVRAEEIFGERPRVPHRPSRGLPSGDGGESSL